MSQRTLQTA